MVRIRAALHFAAFNSDDRQHAVLALTLEETSLACSFYDLFLVMPFF